MNKYCPWGKFVHQRSLTIKHCLKQRLPHYHNYLDPADWFHVGHDLHDGYYDEHKYCRWNVKPSVYVWTYLQAWPMLQ